MRTHLFRGACAVAVVLTLATSAFAQSVVRGKVQDAQGKPVADATIVFEAEGERARHHRSHIPRSGCRSWRFGRRLPSGSTSSAWKPPTRGATRPLTT